MGNQYNCSSLPVEILYQLMDKTFALAVQRRCWFVKKNSLGTGSKEFAKGSAAGAVRRKEPHPDHQALDLSFSPLQAAAAEFDPWGFAFSLLT